MPAKPAAPPSSERVDLPAKAAAIPAPVVLVSCAGKDGRPNLLTIAWAARVCMAPPVIAVAVNRERHSHGLIAEGGDFVVNVPSAAMLEAVKLCGARSGRDGDKFAASGLTAEPSTRVRAPTVRECPLAIECRLVNTVSVGTHDLFLGEVVAVRAAPTAAKNAAMVDWAAVDPLLYLMPEYWRAGEKVGEMPGGSARARGNG
jgi:flavin reductase (DIM6/NTAB) family NADH-FMN oxidoreductase RutF